MVVSRNPLTAKVSLLFSIWATDGSTDPITFSSVCMSLEGPGGSYRLKPPHHLLSRQLKPSGSIVVEPEVRWCEPAGAQPLHLCHALKVHLRLEWRRARGHRHLKSPEVEDDACRVPREENALGLQDQAHVMACMARGVKHPN